MENMRMYEAIVIGAGPGGYEAAIKLGEGGIKTLLVDRTKERLGGTCLNEGCISAKAYLQSAGYASKASFFKECGVILEMNGLDMRRLKEKTIALKDELRSGVFWLLEKAGVELLYGQASFIDAHHIDIKGETIHFEKCIIATGSAVREVEILALDGKRIISSFEVFELELLPASITIVGGGSIGCEFATFFSAFGVEVTLITHGSQLLSGEDEDISKALLRAFKKRNIKVLTNTAIREVKVYETGVELFTEGENQEHIICELVLSAVGRIPYTEGLKLENSGVEQDQKGFIKVNASFETTQKHIYAVGDCIDTLAYAYTAYAEARIAAQNIIHTTMETNTHIAPTAVFSEPAVASCGLREKEAVSQGRDVEVKKSFFKANAKAKIGGDDSGFVKVILCAKSGVILGAAIIGMEATEIIHEMVLAIEKELTLKELTTMIHVHPSISEIIRYL